MNRDERGGMERGSKRKLKRTAMMEERKRGK